MKHTNTFLAIFFPLTILVGLAVAGAYLFFFAASPETLIASMRQPGRDAIPQKSAAEMARKALVVQGAIRNVESASEPNDSEGFWLWFRGLDLTNQSPPSDPASLDWAPEGGVATKLPQKNWPAKLEQLWQIEVGEGHAGAAVYGGAIYLLDHDEEKNLDLMRKLDLATGTEIWRNSYPVKITPSHGITRAVCAIIPKKLLDDTYDQPIVVSFGPLGQVVAWNTKTGKALWTLDLVAKYGTKIPSWYSAQCPYFDPITKQLVLAPSGEKVSLVALNVVTGEVLWEAPNPRDWQMSHTSITPAVIDDQRLYLYSTCDGVMAVDAKTGEYLFDTTEWQMGTAAAASPVDVGDGRFFFCGGYGSRSTPSATMLRFTKKEGKFHVEKLFTLSDRIFGSDQQTPIFYKNHLFGNKKKGQYFVCLDLEGNEVWSSKPEKIGIGGAYTLVDDLILALGDTGELWVMRATPEKFERIAQYELLGGDAQATWGPIAIVGKKMIFRDLTRMACIQLP